MDAIISGDAVQGKPANTIRVESSRIYQIGDRENMPETKRAAEWLQVLVQVLAEGKQYGVDCQIVNYQNDSALTRLPGLRVCSGRSGMGRHLVFIDNMALPGSSLCQNCEAK